jgi:hypothetical protein
MRPPRCRRLAACVAVLAALAGAPGAAAAQEAVDALTLCRRQAQTVERAMALPPGLLLAVGRVESGRSDPASHDVLPWPWTVNDEGEDHVFNSAFDAIAYVVAARARGSRSLDVGCFQVNLQYHPEAFASLVEAFDPAANARAAGEFLAELHGRSGSWEKAVELYHSATPWRGEEYRDRVLSRWTETSLAPPHPEAVAAAAAAPANGAGQPGRRMPRRLEVRVQYPSQADDPAPVTQWHGRRLPRVIVPRNYVSR